MESIIGTLRKLEKLSTDEQLRRQSIMIAALIHIMRLKNDENYGMIRYRNSGDNYACLHIHTGRKIRLG